MSERRRRDLRCVNCGHRGNVLDPVPMYDVVMGGEPLCENREACHVRQTARAEYAALAAAHDAAMAEAERIDWRRRAAVLHRLIGDLRFHNGRLRMERDASETRADAAEAQLAEMRGALEAFQRTWIFESADATMQYIRALEAQLATAREDGARSILAFSHTAPACYLSDDAAVLAAWRAAQTEAR